ncbi:MAG: hypothetical protein PHR68_03680 [Candidatus Gracilibacteria bacterium]|nr:hypothetical protein [Candidatus Gracilibacteria bacterium]
MIDIHDIKGKIDILNYTYLLFFIFVVFFISLFYFVLSKFLDYKEEKKEIIKEVKNNRKAELLEKINELENSIEKLNSKEFYNVFSDLFFEFLELNYKKNLREKTFSELKKTIKEKEILSFIDIFYYRGFMENFSDSLAEKKKNIKNFIDLI